jgi:hypothetical protein
MARRLKQASWTHGNHTVTEGPNPFAIERLGYGGRVTPTSVRKEGWVHIAVPTPVIVDEAHLNIDSVLVRFSTGTSARITNVHVWDGDTKILSKEDENASGAVQVKKYEIPNKPQVFWGVEISLYIKFADTGSQAWVSVVAGGGEFN